MSEFNEDDNEQVERNDYYDSAEKVEEVVVDNVDIENKGLAIASLVLGIVGLITCCCGIFGIVISGLAIVFAIIVFRTNKDNPATNGKNLAMAGLILGIIGVLLALVVTIFGFYYQANVTPEMIEQYMQQF